MVFSQYSLIEVSTIALRSLLLMNLSFGFTFDQSSIHYSYTLFLIFPPIAYRKPINSPLIYVWFDMYSQMAASIKTVQFH